VHQAFDALFELHEGAVGHDVHHFAVVLATHGVASLDTFPRGGLALLEAQRDALAVEVDPQHLDLDLLIEFDHLRGVVDTPPGHVGDVQQTIDATEVHEYAEVGDVLDLTGAGLPLFDVFQQGLLLLLPLFLEQLAAGDYDVHALRIDLDDPSPNRFSDEIGDVVRAAQVDLAGGQEDVDALHIHEQAALDLALDDALYFVAFVVVRGDSIPSAKTICAALGQHRHVVLVETFEEDLELFAGRGETLSELGERDGALRLASDIHDDEAGALVDGVHLGHDDLAGSDVRNGLVEGSFEFFGADLREGRVDLLLQFFRVQLVLPDPP